MGKNKRVVSYGNSFPNKTPSIAAKHVETKKEPRYSENPNSYFKWNPSWNFARCDAEGEWAVNKDRSDEWWEEIVVAFKAFEKMTWAEIFSDGKGNGCGSKHHRIQVADITKKAQDRLLEMKIFDDTLVSLRLGGRKRVWGIITNGIFQVIWYDKNHEICPSLPKHT